MDSSTILDLRQGYDGQKRDRVLDPARNCQLGSAMYVVSQIDECTGTGLAMRAAIAWGQIGGGSRGRLLLKLSAEWAIVADGRVARRPFSAGGRVIVTRLVALGLCEERATNHGVLMARLTQLGAVTRALALKVEGVDV